MFNSNTSGYSLSDLAAVTGNNNRGYGDGFGGGAWSWWIIVLLLFGWGDGNGFGFGNRGHGTKDEIAYSFDFNNLESGIRGIQQGLCDGFYAMNTGMLNGFSGINDAITQGTIADMQGNFGLQTAINNSTNAITGQLNSMAADQAACCCNLRNQIGTSFADLNYNLATQSCDTRRTVTDSARDIIDNNNAGVRSILDFLTQDKIATLTAENQSLKFAASQANQNAYIAASQDAQTSEIIRKLQTPTPVPAYVVPSPYSTVNNCTACAC